MTSASVSAALRDGPTTKSATSLHFGPLVIVGDDHGVPLAGQGALELHYRRGLGGRFDDREIE